MILQERGKVNTYISADWTSTFIIIHLERLGIYSVEYFYNCNPIDLSVKCNSTAVLQSLICIISVAVR